MLLLNIFFSTHYLRILRRFLQLHILPDDNFIIFHYDEIWIAELYLYLFSGRKSMSSKRLALLKQALKPLVSLHQD